MARSLLLLETVGEQVADQFAWPAPLTLQMASCGFANARWDLRTRQVILCYELGTDFADLYREFGASPGPDLMTVMAEMATLADQGSRATGPLNGRQPPI